ncbi:hypothetical protein MPTK1_8g04740 [Marchantia polymorpha subsp. ruderalis]|nr:hypothetical protein Mp_8g04740 [Marchantia polymorpha subsp. ruderalis]
MQSVKEKQEVYEVAAAMQFAHEQTDAMQSVQEDCDAWSVEAEAGGMQALEKGADQEIKCDEEGAPSKQPWVEVEDEEHISIKCGEEVVADEVEDEEHISIKCGEEVVAEVEDEEHISIKCGEEVVAEFEDDEHISIKCGEKVVADEVEDEEHISIKCGEEVVAVPEPKIHWIENLEFREYFAALESCQVTKLQIIHESITKGPHLALWIRSQQAEEIEVTIFGTASDTIYVEVDGRTFGDLDKFSYWLQTSGAIFPLEVALFDAMEVRGFLDRVRDRHMWAARVQLQLRRQDSVITIGDFVSSTAHGSWPGEILYKSGYIDEKNPLPAF